MPDVYARIAEVDQATQERLADILELRAADPQQRAIVESYLAGLSFRRRRALEIGCGTGAVIRMVARRPEVAEAVGVDPSPVFIAKAAELASELGNVVFEQGDGRSLRFPPDDFDTVVVHTTLCHVPHPSWCWRKRLGFCAREESWWCATGTTPRSPWPSASRTRCKPASRQ